MRTVINELARFLGISPEEAKHRVEHYQLSIANEAWQKANPKTPDEVDEF